jgi:hypothetical protein
LASNPLLLTLLCIVFQEAESFPSNRADLYHEGLEVLLKTWDSKRNIARDTLGQNRNLYQELSLQNKEALLGYLAFTTFQTGNYFFKQKTIEQHISDFLRASHIFSNGLECVEIDAKLVLKAIEAQHGILVERARGVYSFSHLTFHEYFTAKQIADCYQVGEHSAFSTLVSHICDQEWNEVFLLTITMLRNADILIAMMKAKIDSLINTDQEIKKFLRWLGERAVFAINNPTLPGLYYKPAIVRSYHSFLLLDDVDIKFSAISIGSAINQTSEIDSPVMNTSIVEDSQKAMVKVVSTAADNERAIAIAIVVASSIHDSLETVTERTVAVTGAIDKAIELTDDSQLKKSLSDLRMQLPPISNEAEVLKDWWQNHGFLWISHLKDAQIKFRHLEHNFRFSYAQIELLQRYYRASLLLINCLNTECCVSTLVRDEVEASLLLPPADIEY